MELRDYQQAAYDAVLKEWDAGHRRTLLVLPTGCGKTVVFSAVANHEAGLGRRVLILAHRGELLEQARETIRKMYGLECGLEKADSTGINSEYVIILGSIQTLAREDRLELFPHDFFGTIIVDEAHHSMSPGYQRVLEWFPEAHVLGVTATPDWGDHQQLDLLKVKGIDVSLINTRGFASAIIDQIMESAKKGLATPKQIQCLEGFGYTGVSEWTKAEATSTLSRLLGKTWELPQDSPR